MSLPSTSAQPLSHAARCAARAHAQTLVELIGADSGQREIDEHVNSWNAAVNPDLEMTPPVMVISNIDLPTESSDPVTVNATSNNLDNIRSPSKESALGHIMGIIRDGGFPLDEEPIQAPLIDALASRLAPASVKPKSKEDLVSLDNPNNLLVHPEIWKLDPAPSQYDPDNFDFTKIKVNRVVSPALLTRTTVPLGSIKVETS